MAVRHYYPTGHVIEADTVKEFGEVWDTLSLKQTELPQKDKASTNVLSFNNRTLTPEVFMKALQDENLHEVLRYIAEQGSKGYINQKDFQKNTGKKSLSGMGKLFLRLTGFPLQGLIKINSNRDVYELNNNAYRNLSDAFKRLNTNT